MGRFVWRIELSAFVLAPKSKTFTNSCFLVEIKPEKQCLNSIAVFKSPPEFQPY